MYSIIPPLSLAPDCTNLDTGDVQYHTSQLTRARTSHQQNTDVTIYTAEGDKVTLSSSSQSQTTYVTYNSLAATQGEFTMFQGAGFNLNANRALIISVDGDLDKQELKDIEKALRTIDKIMRDFLSGDIGHAVASTLKIGKLKSILSLEASLQFKQSLSLEQQLVTEVTSSPIKVAENIMTKSDITALEHINKLADEMAEVVKGSGVKPAKLIRPIHGLFSQFFKEHSRAHPLDSPRLTIAKLIKSNLMNRIKHLSESEKIGEQDRKSNSTQSTASTRPYLAESVK